MRSSSATARPRMTASRVLFFARLFHGPGLGEAATKADRSMSGQGRGRDPGSGCRCRHRRRHPGRGAASGRQRLTCARPRARDSGLGLAIVEAAMKVLDGELEILSSSVRNDGHDETAHRALMVTHDEAPRHRRRACAPRIVGIRPPPGRIRGREPCGRELRARTALSDGYDLVLLDSRFWPSLTEVLRRLRAESAVPIVMLTARRGVRSRAGPEDWRGRLRDQAVLDRRARRPGAGDPPAPGAPPQWRWGDPPRRRSQLDPVRHQVRVDGHLVSLTPSEFRLLDLLASDPERVFSRKADAAPVGQLVRRRPARLRHPRLEPAGKARAH